MSILTVILTGLLSGGLLTGLVAFLRLRTDKDATMVDTVKKSVLIQDRIIDRLESDVAEERAGRLTAEAEVARLRRLLHGHDRDETEG